METKRIYKWVIYQTIGKIMTAKVGEASTEAGAIKCAANYRKNTGYIGSLKKMRQRTQ